MSIWVAPKRGKHAWELGELMSGRVSPGGQGWLLINHMRDQTVRATEIRVYRKQLKLFTPTRLEFLKRFWYLIFQETLFYWSGLFYFHVETKNNQISFHLSTVDNFDISYYVLWYSLYVNISLVYTTLCLRSTNAYTSGAGLTRAQVPLRFV